MAKKEKAAPKVVVERVYNVPLRKEFLKTPAYKRAKKAGAALRQFLEKHMKSEQVSIGRHLNMKIWENGIKKPPHHVNVAVKKYEDGKVEAELVGAPEKKSAEKDKKGKSASKEKPVQKVASEKKVAAPEKKAE